MTNKKVYTGFIWKFLERVGVQGVQFVLQIILARILSPEHYGMLSIMIIFVNLANVFIQTGFNTALIQNKDVTEEDYSSVLWVTFGVSGVLYGVIFVAAPLIGEFYNMPDIVKPLRVLAIMLFPGALNSIQLARISRALDFKKVFYSNLAAIVIAGVVGVIIAYSGGGIWALVVQSLLNTIVACAVMFFTAKLKLYFKCELKRVKVLFSFGWKILVSGLLETLYQELGSLVIGKKHSSEALAFYNRGKQFPQTIMLVIYNTLQSVMLPVMSVEQDNKTKVKQLTSLSLSLVSYIVFPVMAGLAAVAEPLITILLTEKWLMAVPYMQVFCFVSAFVVICGANLQAINAIGRSDVFLKLEIIKKVTGVLILFVFVFSFESPIAIAISDLLVIIVSWFINAYPNRKLIDYTYKEQLGDFLPTLLISLVMFVVVLFVGKLQLNVFLLLVLQVFVGVVVYIILSAIFKLKAYRFLLEQAKRILSEKIKK
ncbi:MAG: lipopolysaccharide biosynthesis protein [Clostridia bacterium]|nr:lipopolysaccharide biosynthesis protein [Clostridia bacterium]